MYPNAKIQCQALFTNFRQRVLLEPSDPWDYYCSILSEVLIHLLIYALYYLTSIPVFPLTSANDGISSLFLLASQECQPNRLRYSVLFWRRLGMHTFVFVLLEAQKQPTFITRPNGPLGLTSSIGTVQGATAEVSRCFWREAFVSGNTAYSALVAAKGFLLLKPLRG